MMKNKLLQKVADCGKLLFFLLFLLGSSYDEEDTDLQQGNPIEQEENRETQATLISEKGNK